MRLIDADALLTERKKSKYYHLPNGDIAIPIIDVEHAPTVKPKPQWIPCSERLPETDDKVLCQTVTKKGVFGMVIGYYFDNRWCCGMNSNVTAWMPLPEPYSGGDE